ncbi:hypothetical protein, partial [Bifidobacterium longum]|uniref:hypothetical protein n=1 Tax=Bifidobacterium longum TaxID=216816 RepID=UPI001F1CC241
TVFPATVFVSVASGHLTLLAVGQVLQRSLEPAKAVFEEWGGGLRSGAFAGRPASHRQAVRVEEEIVDAHREDAVFVADGFD